MFTKLGPTRPASGQHRQKHRNKLGQIWGGFDQTWSTLAPKLARIRPRIWPNLGQIRPTPTRLVGGGGQDSSSAAASHAGGSVVRPNPSSVRQIPANLGVGPTCGRPAHFSTRLEASGVHAPAACSRGIQRHFLRVRCASMHVQAASGQAAQDLSIAIALRSPKALRAALAPSMSSGLELPGVHAWVFLETEGGRPALKASGSSSIWRDVG